MTHVVGGREMDAKAARVRQIGQLEIEVSAEAKNRTTLAELSAHWIDSAHVATPTQMNHAGYGEFGQLAPW